MDTLVYAKYDTIHTVQQKYSLALFIGRFQPFHFGHLYSLKKACEVGEKVVVGIGSSQESGTDNNPWDYNTRKKMVSAVIDHVGCTVVKIIPVPDFPQDPDWVRYVEQEIKILGYNNHEVVVVGNNPWTNTVLKDAGFAVYESGLHNRDELEGVKIRDLLNKNDESWMKRVPTALVAFVKLRKTHSDGE